MLRLLVLTLILGNGLYFAWSQNLLQAYGFAPAVQREPYRLERQLRPQALRLLGARDLPAGEPPARVAARSGACLQAGLFDAAQTALLRSALKTALPAGSWSLDEGREPPRWIVYLGPYPSAEALVKKRAELAALNVRVEPLGNPALQGGLSLGGFETELAADAELKALNRRGVRTAQVLQERAEVRGMRLRLSGVDDALQARLEDLTPALAGKVLSPCR